MVLELDAYDPCAAGVYDVVAFVFSLVLVVVARRVLIVLHVLVVLRVFVTVLRVLGVLSSYNAPAPSASVVQSSG